MSNWSQQNYAHWGTYVALGSLRMLDTTVYTFKDSEILTMPYLGFHYEGYDSGNQERAKVLATDLYEFFVLYYRPEWQSKDINHYSSAINKIYEVLIDKDKTIGDLGKAIDDIFKFTNEAEG